MTFKMDMDLQTAVVKIRDSKDPVGTVGELVSKTGGFWNAAEQVHGELPVCDHRPEALHHHGEGGFTATGLGVLSEDRVAILRAMPVMPKSL